MYQILCTMLSMLSIKMEQKWSVLPSRTVFHFQNEYGALSHSPNIQHTLLGQQSTTDISRTQHSDKNRDADDIVVLSSDVSGHEECSGRAIKLSRSY